MKVLSYKDLGPRKGICWTRQHIDREEKEGRFPQRVRLGGNTIAWVDEELDAWLAQRAAERQGEGGVADDDEEADDEPP